MYSFKFSILLPATLATLDYHTFGRISYILTARVEGIPDSSSFVSIFKGKDSVPSVQYTDIPFASDFVSVISRSDKMARELAKSPTSGTSPLSRTGSRSSISNAHGQADLSPRMGALGLSGTPSTYPDDSAIAIADGGSPSLMGLYHRRQSNDMSAIPPISLNPDSSSQSPRNADDNRSIASKQSIDGAKSEKNGWLKGDLFAVRSLLVHANPSPTGGVNILELRKEGFVDGLGSWRFTASSDVVSDPALVSSRLHHIHVRLHTLIGPSVVLHLGSTAHGVQHPISLTRLHNLLHPTDRDSDVHSDLAADAK